ncbi:pitrilysin family protein [uncultured Aquimarina sp.]|uniref:M16 family metallopeptidase n=1 Tax=uncultured Aquimarina sp. TaxID=575652 RepID=UPI002614029F|nr:M16 family metallopeptidase [uncultured Aquimarina sp.]
MKSLKSLLLLSFVVLLSNCKNSSNQEKNTEKELTVEKYTDAAGFSYETVSNDPTGLRLYTLDNGLKVYLSKNIEEPKIQTYIAVRAGSNYDPKESTGLAHYLEHMVFKGTDEIGTQDFEKESVYLKQISDLYEQHRLEKDLDKKKEIYKKIDEISLEASKISIPNEYDKMVNSLGAEGTNAHTWFEETVYKNKIPANELDKWLTVESERFSQLVLRLFHTELEAVYEEFNRGQDNDFRKSYAAMLDGLFPNHPYGQQKTIGTSEHLKNPSMVAIHNYFDTYYVPNNMAVVLVGDLDFDSTIKKVDVAFGKMKRKDVTHPVLPKEEAITSPIVKEVFGPTAESISVAFRSEGLGTKEEKLLTLADMILANGNAGLIDLNLNQKQLVQRAGCSPTILNDYGYHVFNGTPKADQTLDDVKDLLLGEIEKLKKGEFEDWMISAVINDLKLSQTKSYENSTALASAYYNAFIHHQDWKDKVDFLNELKKITKQELVDFANSFYKDNYVVTYKRKGEDKNIVKVENPGITPIELNRDKESTFLKKFNGINTPELNPQYVDYKSAIKEIKTSNGLSVSYIDNPNNELFDLNIIFDMGKDHDRKVSLAAGYLDYLGTDKYSPEELKQEFYKIGINYYVFASEDKTYVGLSGLKENLDEGLVLLEHLWNNAVPNQDTYNKYVDKVLKGRQDGKTQKGNILFTGLMNYGLYGENSRLRNIYSASELQSFNPQELVDKVKELRNYKQRIFYYGKDIDAAITSLDKNHTVNSELSEYPEKKVYLQKETGGNVYFVDYDMVQSEMLLLAKGAEFDPKKMAASRLFNTYFGSGLSSIVFQEIRESKSLAYSAFSAYANASEKGKSDLIYAYIGTQANKMPEAVDAMMELMTDMPEAEEQFNQAKDATLKKIAAQRITKSNIFWTYESLKKRGIENDNREEMYNVIKNMELADLKTFFNENIKGENYNVLVIGNKKDVNMDALKKLGEVKEMDIDYLFNYEKNDKDIKM